MRGLKSLTHLVYDAGSRCWLSLADCVGDSRRDTWANCPLLCLTAGGNHLLGALRPRILVCFMQNPAYTKCVSTFRGYNK